MILRQENTEESLEEMTLPCEEEDLEGIMVICHLEAGVLHNLGLMVHLGDLHLAEDIMVDHQEEVGTLEEDMEDHHLQECGEVEVDLL